MKNFLKLIYFAFLLSACSNNSTKSNGTITQLFDSNYKEKETIKNQIEQAYFNLNSGVYSMGMFSNNNMPEDFPFYNMDAMQLSLATGILGVGRIFGALLSVDSTEEKLKLFFEPSAIEIVDFKEKEAMVKYKLYAKIFDKEKKDIPVEMTMKKIGGKWKLDGKKFLSGFETIDGKNK